MGEEWSAFIQEDGLYSIKLFGKDRAGFCDGGDELMTRSDSAKCHYEQHKQAVKRTTL